MTRPKHKHKQATSLHWWSKHRTIVKQFRINVISIDNTAIYKTSTGSHTTSQRWTRIFIPTLLVYKITIQRFRHVRSFLIYLLIPTKIDHHKTLSCFKSLSTKHAGMITNIYIASVKYEVTNPIPHNTPRQTSSTAHLSQFVVLKQDETREVIFT